jgi:Mg2+ and Co2+ transporter CorA
MIALGGSIFTRATQEDSFAMKTIAIVGMIFLPGTFIAVKP